MKAKKSCSPVTSNVNKNLEVVSLTHAFECFLIFQVFSLLLIKFSNFTFLKFSFFLVEDETGYLILQVQQGNLFI